MLVFWVCKILCATYHKKLETNTPRPQKKTGVETTRPFSLLQNPPKMLQLCLHLVMLPSNGCGIPKKCQNFQSIEKDLSIIIFRRGFRGQFFLVKYVIYIAVCSLLRAKPRKNQCVGTESQKIPKRITLVIESWQSTTGCFNAQVLICLNS